MCKKIHLWLAFPFGLIIAITCLSGAVLVFETQINEWSHPERYTVAQVQSHVLPLEQLVAEVSTTLPDSVQITGVTISGDPQRAYQFSLSKPRRASLCVDPYTGQVLGRSSRTPFFSFVFRTHRWLLDSANPDGGIFWGKMIVGISTLLFVFVLISGLVVWIPRTVRSLKNRLKIATTKGRLRFWYDLHLAGGIYSFALLLVMALTGLTWSFSWYRTGFYGLFGAGQTTKGHQPEKETKKERSKVSYYAWEVAYRQVANQHPGFEKITIANGKAAVSIGGWGNARATDNYTFDPHNGQITDTTPYDQAPASTKLRGWIYSLHVGSWGGWFSQVLTFVVALIGAVLPLTGYYFLFRRFGSKKARRALMG